MTYEEYIESLMSDGMTEEAAIDAMYEAIDSGKVTVQL